MSICDLLLIIPSLSLSLGECKKCGKILASFIDPKQSFGPDKIIPPHILSNAKVRSSTIWSYSIVLTKLAVVSLGKDSEKIEHMLTTF